MFCTKCGAKVADGQAFCTACGNKIGAAPVSQPNQTQPAAPAQPKPAKPQFAVPEQLKSIKMPKVNLEKVKLDKIKLDKINLDKFNFKKDSDGEKKPFVNPFAGNKALLVRVLSIACVLLLLLSYSSSVSTSIENIPIVGLALAGSGEDIDELKDEFDDLADMLEKGMEDDEELLEEMLSKSERKDLEKFAKTVRDCGKRFSLNNMSNLLKWYEKLEDTDLDEIIPSIDNVVDEAKEIQAVLSIIKTFLLVGALFCAVFVFFGGFYYRPGLAIFGTVLVALYCLSYCPIWMLFINLIVDIYMIIQASDVKKAKKAAAQAEAVA